MLRKLFLIWSFAIITVFACGCAEIQKTWQALFPPPPTCDCMGIPRYIAGYSVKSKPIKYSVLGTGSRTIFILGSIHGDEPAGAVLTEQLCQYLSKNGYILKDRTAVLLQAANPDGLALGTRANANGVDLNRNFPADNRMNNTEFGLSALSEPESAAIKSLIEKYKPDCIISIHQPYNCIDYDGPAENLAKIMAEHCPMPVRKLGAMPGSLGSYAGLMLGIPIITYELPPEVEKISRNELWEKYSPALLAAISYSAQ